MKKKDMIVIGAIALIILGIYVGIQYFMKPTEMIVVKHHSKVVLELDINKDGYYTINGDIGEVNIEVKDKQYRVIEVDCPDKICEKEGWKTIDDITPIVCMPNAVIVERAL